MSSLAVSSWLGIRRLQNTCSPFNPVAFLKREGWGDVQFVDHLESAETCNKELNSANIPEILHKVLRGVWSLLGLTVAVFGLPPWSWTKEGQSVAELKHFLCLGVVCNIKHATDVKSSETDASLHNNSLRSHNASMRYDYATVFLCAFYFFNQTSVNFKNGITCTHVSIYFAFFFLQSLSFTKSELKWRHLNLELEDHSDKVKTKGPPHRIKSLYYSIST